MSVALHTAGLSKHWGGFKANSDIDFSLEAGSRHALIGPNGAGKTTFINLLTGYLVPSAGEVFLGDVNVSRMSQHERVRRGMTRTFQINTLFPGLTVLESVLLAITVRKGRETVWWKSAFRQRDELDEARALLASLQLESDLSTITRSLPYGKQRLLEIALALATKPRILLLDEPAAGIPSSECAELFEVLASLPREVTILLIEHDMGLVFRFAEHITVLVAGSILVQGTPAEIASDRRVREVYLGEPQGG